MVIRKTLGLAASLALFGATLFAQGITDLRSDRRPHRPHRPHRQQIIITDHHVKTAIVDQVATTTVKQIFKNPNRWILEGTYLFPVPENAVMKAFSMVMNGKKVEGEVLERDKARKIYEDIVRRTRDPGLLEYAGKRLFKARVYPINPNSTIEIELSYVEELRQDGGLAEYRYPLKTQAFSRSPVTNLSMVVSLKATSELKTVFSSSHQVDKQRKGTKEMTLSFEGKNVEAARDFQLYFSRNDREFGLELLTAHPEKAPGYFMMALSPKQTFSPEDILPKDVVFVVDTSGSMKEDDKMAQARSALIYGIKGLNPSDRFSVVSFSTEARAMGTGLQDVNASAIADAVKHVQGLSARGGTNIHDALLSAVKQFKADSKRVKILVFLTDGRPTVGETRVPQIIKDVGKNMAGGIRLFSFGVGYDVNSQLLDALAEENGGTRDYVTPSKNIEVVLSSFFDKIASPVMSDLEVFVDGIKLSEVYPKKLPDLFKGSELTVFGRYDGSGSRVVRLKGRVGDTVREYIYEAKFSDKATDYEFVPLLWAKRKVGYLWDQIRLNGEKKEIREEIVRLGKKYGIATPYTSFLVVEEGELARRPRDGADADLFLGRDRRESARADRNGWRGASPGGATGPGGGSGSGVGNTKKASPGTTGGGRLRGRAPRRSAAPEGKTAVQDSLKSKRLRENIVEADEEVEDLDIVAGEKRARKKIAVRRVGARTFESRDGTWVDVALDKVDAAERKKNMEKVKPFSTRYFELLKQHKELAKLLADMPSLMIKIGDAVIWILPEEPAEPAPKVETPKTEAPKK